MEPTVKPIGFRTEVNPENFQLCQIQIRDLQELVKRKIGRRTVVTGPDLTVENGVATITASVEEGLVRGPYEHFFYKLLGADYLEFMYLLDEDRQRYLAEWLVTATKSGRVK